MEHLLATYRDGLVHIVKECTPGTRYQTQCGKTFTGADGLDLNRARVQDIAKYPADCPGCLATRVVPISGLHKFEDLAIHIRQNQKKSLQVQNKATRTGLLALGLARLWKYTRINDK